MAGKAPFQANVIIRNGYIDSIGRDLPVPIGARILDISGRYILPGFVDMHAHVTFLPTGTLVSFDRVASEEILKRMLAYGITTVRNPAAPSMEGVKLRDDVAHGKIPAHVAGRTAERQAFYDRAGDSRRGRPTSRGRGRLHQGICQLNSGGDCDRH